MNVCKLRNTNKQVEFLGVFQYSSVVPPSALAGGHNGGVVAYPMALVIKDGEVIKVNVENICWEEVTE